LFLLLTPWEFYYHLSKSYNQRIINTLQN